MREVERIYGERKGKKERIYEERRAGGREDVRT